MPHHDCGPSDHDGPHFSAVLTVIHVFNSIVKNNVHELVVALEDASYIPVSVKFDVHLAIHELSEICSVPLFGGHALFIIINIY